jgi:hypothetical protein
MPGGAWLESLLYSFPEGVGTPFGPVLAPDGNVYAGASNGGNGLGAIYQLQPPASPGGSWTTTVVFNFPEDRRENNPGSLSLGSDGAFYGTIPIGGIYKIGAGAVFKLQPPAVPGGIWTETILYYFRGGHDGATPNSVMLGPDGIVYGTTFGDNTLAYGTGTVFSLTPPAAPAGEWIKKTLHTFSSRRAPGYYYGPDSPLIMRNGKLYGASGLLDTQTNKPGGLVYELSPPSTPGGEWTCTILHRWHNGQVPSYGSIAMDPDGRTLYGGTYVPDAAEGTIYRISW